MGRLAPLSPGKASRYHRISRLDFNVPGRDNVHVLRAPLRHFGNFDAAHVDGRNNL